MSVRLLVADRSHDAGIRKLLRETPMVGRDVSVSLQCEPSYFDAVAVEGDEHHAIVAVDGDAVVCVGGVSVRDRYYNGRLVRAGYLGHLRLARSHAGRADVLRRGYGLFRDVCRSVCMDVCFTSIAADNDRARLLLERGLRGLPRYTFAGEVVTLVVRSRWGPTTAEPAAVAAAGFQFAPRDCVRSGLSDQRANKQAVVTRYSWRLAVVRPVCNAAGRLLRRGVILPPVGVPIQQAFATGVGDPKADIRPVLATAATRGIAAVAIGLDARDPRVPHLRRRHWPFVYRTRLYTVHWPDDPPIDPPDGRLLYPEIATL